MCVCVCVCVYKKVMNEMFAWYVLLYIYIYVS